jgi:hypothetical protein
MRYEDYLVQFNDEPAPTLRQLCLDTPDNYLQPENDHETFYYLDTKETRELLATPSGGVWGVAGNEWKVIVK